MPISTINVSLVYPDSRRAHIRLREKALNQGADGLIYASPDGKLALKLYHNPEKDPERPEKIRQMLQAPPDDNGLEHFAWPVAQVVNRKGRFIGYAMPLLPLGEYESLELLLTRKGRRLAGLPESRMFRIQAAENLARRVAQLHDKGHYVIDMKPANLLVHRKTADIVVVDCDGFAIQGQHSFIPGHQYTPGYIAPEAWKNRVEPEALGKAQDLFALAVIIFQLVNEGLHPYQGVPDAKQNIPGDTQNRIGEDLFAHGQQRHPRMRPSPWSLHRDFPGSLAQAFHNAFTSINRRPDAERWVTVLKKQAGQLRQCKNERSHCFWGIRCPICELNSVSIQPREPQRTTSLQRGPRPERNDSTTPQPRSPQLARQRTTPPRAIRWLQALQARVLNKLNNDFVVIMAVTFVAIIIFEIWSGGTFVRAFSNL